MGVAAATPRRTAAFLAAVLLATAVWPSAALAAVRPPAMAVPSAVLKTLDGEVVLYGKYPAAQRKAASTIKMLNALVVRERAELDDVVVVPRAAAAISDGDVGLVAGQRVTVYKLLELMMVASANDAAEALAIHIAGSEKAYVALMNAKARQLGLRNTLATDPHGLWKREHTTANDLAVLGRVVMADPVLRQIVRARSAVVPLSGGRTRTVRATNELLGVYAGMQGVKTGYTRPAGFCLVGSAKRGKVELVGVVMGAESNAARFREMRKLLDWGFAHTRMRRVVSKDATAGIVPVVGGVVPAVAAKPLTTYEAIEFDGSPLRVDVRLDPSVRAPIRKGRKIGYVLVWRNGSLLQQVPLYADRSVAEKPDPAPALPESDLSARTLPMWEQLGVMVRAIAARV